MRSLWISVLLASICAGCGADGAKGTDDFSSTGEVAFGLTLPDGRVVERVDFELSRQGMEVRRGTLPIGADGTASGIIADVPAGEGYQLSLQTPAAECRAAAELTVEAGTTTRVQLVLQCEDATGPTGAATVEGTLITCPDLGPLLSATPSRAEVGGEPVALRVSANRPLQYDWTFSSGLVSIAGDGAVTFRCGTAGTATVTATARGDAACLPSRRRSVPIECESDSCDPWQSEACTCSDSGSVSCDPYVAGRGTMCCGGRLRAFYDSPCWDPLAQDAGSPDCSANPLQAGCPCAEPGAVHCRSPLQWRLVCSNGAWREDVLRVCC